MNQISVSSNRLLDEVLPDAIHSVWFVGNKRLLISGQYCEGEGIYGAVRLVSVEGRLLAKTRGGQSTGYTCVHPSGFEYACTSNISCTIHSLRSRRLPLIRRLQIDRDGPNRLLYTADGRWLIGGGTGKYNMEAQWISGSPFPPKDAVFAPLVRWDTADWTPTRLPEYGQSVSSLAINPGGDTLLVGGADGGIQLWDLTRWELTGEWQSPRGQEDGKFPLVNAVQITPDGRTLYAALSRRPYLRSFTLPGFTTAAALPQEKKVHAMVLLPDGRTLVTGDDFGDVNFWDAANGTCIGRYTAEGKRQLVIDLRTGESRTEATLANSVYALAVSPDGRTLAVGDSVGRVHLLDLTP